MAITTPNYSNINLDEMAASIGLKPKHMPILIMSFLEESTPILEALKNSIASNAYESTKLHAHSIKGSAGNLRFTGIYDMAKEMELAATQNDTSFEYATYLEAITQAIATIKL